MQYFVFCFFAFLDESLALPSTLRRSGEAVEESEEPGLFSLALSEEESGEELLFQRGII